MRDFHLSIAAASFAIVAFALPARAAVVAYVDRLDPFCGGNEPCYATIQGAIDASPDGATIIVRPATYPESVDLDKNHQTLVSADGSAVDGSPDTILQPPGPPDAPSIRFGHGGVRIQGSGNTLQGFRIVDVHLDDAAFAHLLVRVEGDGNAIRNNQLTGRDPNPADGVFPFNEDVGILVQGGTAFGNDGIANDTIIGGNEVSGVCLAIRLDSRDPLSGQDDAVIVCNDIHDNCDGIEIPLGCEPAFWGESPVRRIDHNNIRPLLPFGGLVLDDEGDCNPAVDATNNWWGDPSGPGGLGPGSGTVINARDGITFRPWLSGPKPDVCPPLEGARIGDRVWIDRTADGVQDPGEPGVAAVDVRLRNCADDSLSETTLTDAAGNYLFQVAPGDYYVEFVLPAGSFFAPSNAPAATPGTDSDADPATGRTACTTLSDGEEDPSWDAGLYRTARLGDRVWNDTNANGLQDPGEPGVAGVPVALHDCAGALASSTTTGADGSYAIDVAPGSYFVVFTPPGGYVFSPADQGADDAVDNDADLIGGRAPAAGCMTLASDGVDQGWDAGIYPSSALGDLVWNDTDADGIQDAGEVGIPGVTVNLLDCGASVLQTIQTNASGQYAFSGLSPGCYVVELVKPAGFNVSPQDQGSDDCVESDGDPATLRTAQIVLPAGVTDPCRDFGLNPLRPCRPVEIASGFNGKAIPAGTWLWFNSVIKRTQLPPGSAPVTVTVTSQTIRFRAGGVDYALTVPASEVRFSPAATAASTSLSGGTWITTVPRDFQKPIFISGLAYQVPVDFPGGIAPVKWSGVFSTASEGVEIEWKWAAAVYTRFEENSDALRVKPVDGHEVNPYGNNHRAGAPERYTSFVTGGARGGGGSNYTGSLTAPRRWCGALPATASAGARRRCSSCAAPMPTARDRIVPKTTAPKRRPQADGAVIGSR